MFDFSHRRQMTLNPYVLMIVLSAWIVLTANRTFFAHLAPLYPTVDYGFFWPSTALVIAGVLLLLCALLAYRWTLKPVLITLLLLAAITAYFTDHYATVFDTTMLENVRQTNRSEAGDLLSLALLWSLVLYGVLPAYVVYRLRVSFPAWQWSLLQRLGLVLLALILIATPLLLFSKSYTSFFREHKPLRYYVNPITPIYSLGKLAHEQYVRASRPQTLLRQAEDMHSIETDEKPELVVFVVGEAVRSDHLALNGYSRDTTPQLATQKNLFSYTHATSCGTATAYSVPCMFSFSDKQRFDLNHADYQENVLDKLAQHGVRLLWRDNNSDPKGVMARLGYEDYLSSKHNPLCDEECRDEGMLVGLPEWIAQAHQDTLIVLHQMGNHGPAYFKRYPKNFARFTPVCQSNELGQCDQQSIINAYDNAILYTDYFLSQTIDMLKTFTGDYEVTLIYMSDHGESLGEGGVYLHGMPYAFAPEAQTHVPLIVWVGEHSDVLLDSIDTDAPTSHDAITPTLIRIFELDTADIVGKAGLFDVSEDAHQ